MVKTDRHRSYPRAVKHEILNILKALITKKEKPQILLKVYGLCLGQKLLREGE
jgi:hypothetical protein